MAECFHRISLAGGIHWVRLWLLNGREIIVQLAEQYRPASLDEVIGQDKAVKKIRFLETRGLGGRAYWIAGLSGTGKTTLAKIIAGRVAGEWSEEIDAAACTPKAITDWEYRTRCRPLDGNGHCLIVNEAHGLRKDSVKQFLVSLERLKSYATVIFTTTLEGQLSLFDDCIDAGPLTSRCTVIQLESRGEALELSFAVHLRAIAVKEGMDGQPIEKYVNLVRESKFNLRQCLQEIESGAMCV